MPAGQTPRPGRAQRRTRTLIHPAKDHTAAHAPHAPPTVPRGTDPFGPATTRHQPHHPPVKPIRPKATQPGGDRTRTDDPLLAKQVLSQLCYAPISVASPQVSVIRKTKPVVLTTDDWNMGQGGLEPPTPRLSSVCSNQLSYWPASRNTTPAEPTSRAEPVSRGRDMPTAPFGPGRAGPAKPRHDPLRGHRRAILRHRPSRPAHLAADPSCKRPGGTRPISLKGGDPAAGSPTATLLRLHPSR